jgi:hypothetical protein
LQQADGVYPGLVYLYEYEVYIYSYGTFAKYKGQILSGTSNNCSSFRFLAANDHTAYAYLLAAFRPEDDRRLQNAGALSRARRFIWLADDPNMPLPEDYSPVAIEPNQRKLMSWTPAVDLGVVRDELRTAVFWMISYAMGFSEQRPIDKELCQQKAVGFLEFGIRAGLIPPEEWNDWLDAVWDRASLSDVAQKYMEDMDDKAPDITTMKLQREGGTP